MLKSMWAGKFLRPVWRIDYDDVVVSGLYKVGTIAILCLKSTRHHQIHTCALFVELSFLKRECSFILAAQQYSIYKT